MLLNFFLFLIIKIIAYKSSERKEDRGDYKIYFHVTKNIILVFGILTHTDRKIALFEVRESYSRIMSSPWTDTIRSFSFRVYKYSLFRYERAFFGADLMNPS
jgi:exonuclease III